MHKKILIPLFALGILLMSSCTPAQPDMMDGEVPTESDDIEGNIDAGIDSGLRYDSQQQAPEQE